MNGYRCIYKGKSWECYADTALKAQQMAAEHFKAKKQYLVSVYLCEKLSSDGRTEQVTHVADF